jgi:glycerol-3-phosphate cytidylyltransferase
VGLTDGRGDDAAPDNIDFKAGIGAPGGKPSGNFCAAKAPTEQRNHAMIRIGYAPGAYDLFHVGHLNLLRRAKERCEYLIAGVVADDVLTKHKGVTPIIPLAERMEIVCNIRFVDAAHAATTNDKVEIWKDLKFNVLFKGSDWQGTEKGDKLERDFAALGVELVYLPYTLSTSSSALRKTLHNIDVITAGASVLAPDSHAVSARPFMSPGGKAPSESGWQYPI